MNTTYYSPLFLLPLLTALMACGSENGLEIAPQNSQKHQAIINGELCDENNFPSAVALITDAEIQVPWFGEQTIRQATCTGTLIAPDVVLTAAHCLDPTLATFGFGEVQSLAFYVSPQADLTSMETENAVIPESAQIASDWVAHPDFDIDGLQSAGGPINLKDVALVFLDEPLDIDPAIVITREEAEQLTVDKEVSIVGWGMQTAEGGSAWEAPPPGTTGKKVCADSFINEVGSHEFQVGADASTSRKCHGDSGGPSYMKVTTDGPKNLRVVGITSHAYDESDCQKGGIDTRVDVWLDWIEAEMIAACDSGARTQCDTPGILPPPPPEKDMELEAQNQQTPEELGCGCHQSNQASPKDLAGLALVLVGLFRTRRR